MTFQSVIEAIGTVIDAAGVAAIVIGALIATVVAVRALAEDAAPSTCRSGAPSDARSSSDSSSWWRRTSSARSPSLPPSRASRCSAASCSSAPSSASRSSSRSRDAGRGRRRTDDGCRSHRGGRPHLVIASAPRHFSSLHSPQSGEAASGCRPCGSACHPTRIPWSFALDPFGRLPRDDHRCR